MTSRNNTIDSLLVLTVLLAAPVGWWKRLWHLTVSQLQALVRAGQVHYFLLSGGFGGAGGSGNAALVQWVEAHGTTITVGGVTLHYVSSAAAG